MIQAFTARIPLRRMGIPDDIAKVALFLVSSASDYMTGSLLVVAGGFLQAEERYVAAVCQRGKRKGIIPKKLLTGLPEP